jgi:hypothetical protein
MEREMFKPIPINGRKFVVGRFEALQGNALISKAIRILPSLGYGEVLGLPNGGSPVDDDIFIDFQKKCLKYCYEDLQGGRMQVINSEGKFGVIGLENDGGTIFILVLAVIAFNAEDFFDESKWKDFKTDPSSTTNPATA